MPDVERGRDMRDSGTALRDSGAPLPAVGAITVYTDGSCERNGRPDARGAFACVVPEAPGLGGGWPLRDGVVPTSNRAEFAAFLKACEIANALDSGATPLDSGATPLDSGATPLDSGATPLGPGARRTLLVVTDSQLLQKTVASWLAAWRKAGWRKADGSRVANLDLCERMAAAIDARAVVVKHVAAHTERTDGDSTGNRAADRLARQACAEQRDVGVGRDVSRRKPRRP